MGAKRRGFLDGITVISAFCAIGISWLAFQKHTGPRLVERQERRIEGWERFRLDGRSLGGGGGAVTLVEFGDYECPVCRAYHPWLQGLVTEFPERLRVVFAHFPLSYHRAAYPAARAVECAANQERFRAFHDRLMSEDEWMLNAQREFQRIAVEVGIADLEEFRVCIMDTGKVPAVERHRRIGSEIRIDGVPTLILDGIMLGDVDSTTLAHRIRTYLEDPAR